MDPSTINWQELTATAAMCGVFIWGIVKGLPTFYVKVSDDQTRTREQFVVALEEHRVGFTEALSSQRAEFREDLKATRDQSRILAQSGHDAVVRVSCSVEQLSEKINELNGRVKA
jgi:hypothetical protein